MLYSANVLNICGKSVIVIFSLIILASPNKVSAQLCLSRFGPDNCKYGIISEVGLGFPLITNSTLENQSSIDFGIKLGVTKHLNNRLGIGVYAFSNIVLITKFSQLTNRLRPESAYIMTGFSPRFSYYIQNKYEINFSPGIIIMEHLEDIKRFPGFSVETGFTWKNHFGVFARVDFRNEAIRRNTIYFEKETILKIGVKTGGKVGGIAIAVFSIFGLIGLAAS